MRRSRQVLAALCGVLLAHSEETSASSRKPAPQPLRLAITFDDLPLHGLLPPGATPLSVISAIIAALRSAGAPATYGFVNAGNPADGQNDAVLNAWRSAGFPLGNHGWSHANLAQIDPAAASAEITRGEAVIAGKMGSRDWRWFRYPFLSEGQTPDQVAALRGMLAAGRYKVAAVTMSFGDYAWNGPYARCVARNDTAAIAALEARYLAAARAEADRARSMSRAATGRDIPYVLLMHVGAFDARMLPRLLALYREMGFRLVGLPEAEADSFYANARDLTLPGPSATLESALRAKGLPIPAAAPAAALPGPEVCA
ncbi:MAG: polysaccharide deacetylase family protein [Sphingomonas sp.]|uniref:polysaccharide deacetylase family protein n=1 Tax=Sphingomonas sp. TaxID=28214 RepID=UPI001AC685CF|nr:polysaccharide deacetylase family protein [Sphingomonas sp.]MBN8807848.1 polysaccharide deacetylase family protein [Sphingomonas sp.]